jgi:hypothetical protein
MNMPNAGVYTATIGNRSIYESEGGALICCLECLIDEFTAITAYVTLALKDGSLSESGLKTCKEALKWPGGGLDSLIEHVETLPREHEVSIVCEPEEYKGKPVMRVKWVNPADGAAGGVKPWGDRKAMIAKYGNKFRAMSGGVPAKAATPKPAVPAAPPAPAKPAAPPAPAGPPSDMMTVWNRLCEVYPDGEKATEAWHKLQEKAGKPQEQITPEEWGGFLVKINAKFPPADAGGADDEEDIPY